MKKILLFLFLLFSICSCNSVKRIGAVNMISNRNIDYSAKYQLISSYAGGSNREIKKSRATSIEEAIDKTVRKVPGGEYLMNARIYLVKKKYIAVEGDVWGISTQISFKGFKIGDKVTWKKSLPATGYETGVISAMRDDKTCIIKVDNDGRSVEMKYEEIVKVQ